jgi:hypothetical protein
MTIVEFLLISFVYGALFFLIKKNDIEDVVKNVLTFLLQQKETQSVLLFLKWYQERSPVVAKEGSVFAVKFWKSGKRYSVYLPYDRRQREDKEYVVEKGETMKRFLVPSGVKLYCTKEDFRADDLREVV